jgi:hypothetical protein
LRPCGPAGLGGSPQELGDYRQLADPVTIRRHVVVAA